jgi:hypothetical protein
MNISNMYLEMMNFFEIGKPKAGAMWYFKKKSQRGSGASMAPKHLLVTSEFIRGVEF